MAAAPGDGGGGLGFFEILDIKLRGRKDCRGLCGVRGFRAVFRVRVSCARVSRLSV